MAQPDEDTGGHDVTVNRIYTRSSHAAIEIYQAIYTGTVVDPLNKETIGKTDRIRHTLTQAWVGYQAFESDSKQPIDFRQYLQSTADHTEAWGYVVALRSLFKQLRLTGLTNRKFDHVKWVLLEREGITPDGLDRQAFEHIIFGTVPFEIGAAPLPPHHAVTPSDTAAKRKTEPNPSHPTGSTTSPQPSA